MKDASRRRGNRLDTSGVLYFRSGDCFGFFVDASDILTLRDCSITNIAPYSSKFISIFTAVLD